MFYLALGWAALSGLYLIGKIGKKIEAWWARRQKRQSQARPLSEKEVVELARLYLRECQANRRALEEWDRVKAVREAERIVRTGR